MKKLSKRGKINWFDGIKAFIMLIGTSVMGSLIPIISTGKFPEKEQLVLILGTAIGAGLTYLLKQLRTDENGQVFK